MIEMYLVSKTSCLKKMQNNSQIYLQLTHYYQAIFLISYIIKMILH
jgi:hypothetical protein